MSEDGLHPLDYASAGDDHLLTVLRVGNYEAELAAAKLRSEGIDCFIADQNFSVTDPLVGPDVRLQVRARDLARARAILDEVADPVPPGAVAAGGETAADYADEPWRCPGCHRKTVELLPSTPFWRFVRNAFWVTLAAPFVVFVVSHLLPDEYRGRFLLSESFVCPWAALIVLMFFPLVFRDRAKRCTSCGHAWNKDGPLPKEPTVVEKS
jgi:hypothetical protein